MKEVLDLLKKDEPMSIISVFESLMKINSDKLLEIEARVGTIVDRRTGLRLDLGANHPVIFTSNNSDINFISGVSSEFSQNLAKKFKSIEPECSEEVVIIKNRVRTIFSKENITIMKKTKIKTFEIYFPDKPYDIRVSFSKEEPIENSKVATEKSAKGRVCEFRRERSRTSYVASPYRFDFTTIKSPKENLHEIEVEIIDFKFDRKEFFNIITNIIN